MNKPYDSTFSYFSKQSRNLEQIEKRYQYLKSLTPDQFKALKESLSQSTLTFDQAIDELM